MDQDSDGWHLGIGVTVFTQQFRDLVQFTFLTASAPTDPNYFNIAAADASGVEAMLRVRPYRPGGGVDQLHPPLDRGDRRRLRFGEAADFVEGERLLRRPDDAVTVRADATVDGSVQARRDGLVGGEPRRHPLRASFPEPSQRVTLPSYTTVDLSATATLLHARPGTPGLDLTARVENLFDEDYEQAAGYPAPGRALFVGASAQVP